MTNDEDPYRPDSTQPLPPGSPGDPYGAPPQGGYGPPPGPYGPPPQQGAYGHPQPQGYGYGSPGYGPMMEPRKEPALSLIVAFFLPGVGSMINGEVGKGIGILAGYVISWFLVIILIGLLGILAFWIWGMIDAYQGAVAFNRRHGYPG